MKKILTYLALSSCLLGCEDEEIVTKDIEKTDQKYHENVITLSKEDLNYIDSIDGSNLYIGKNNNLNEGDFIFGGISDKTPNGIMKKIESFDESKTKAKIRDASLEEIIKNGSIKIEEKLSAEDAELQNLKSKNIEYDLQKSFSKIIHDEDKNLNTKDDQIKLSGDFYFNSGITLDARFENGVKEIYAVSYVNGILNAEFSGSIGKEISKELNAFNIRFSPIPIGTTGFVVTPKIGLDIGAKVKLGNTFSLPFSCKGNVLGEIYYQNNSWKNETSKELDFISEDYDFNFNSYAKGFVKPKITFSINEVVGPFLEIEEYIRLESPSEDFDWKIDCGYDLNLGCNAGLFSFFIPEYKKKISGDKFKIMEGNFSKKLLAELKSDKQNGKTPLEINFDGSSSQPKEKIVEYLFDFGNGETYAETNDSKDDFFDGKTKYTYKEEGTFYPKLIVKNAKNETSKDSLEIVVKNEQIELKSDDNSQESFWAFDGYCKDEYSSETSYLEKNFEIPTSPFEIQKLKIMFSKKPSSNIDYILHIEDNEEIQKTIAIKTEEISLDEWHTVEINEPLKIFNSINIIGRNQYELENCGNPDISGWGVSIDEDNKGDSYKKILRIGHDFVVNESYNLIDGEFMIRLIGK